MNLKFFIIPLILILSLFSYTVFAETIFSTGNVDATSLSAFNDSAFVLAWCDETLDDILFTTYNVGGKNISEEITVDTEVGLCPEEGDPVSVSTFNETHFVIAWYDDTTAGSEDAFFQIFQINGSSVTSPVLVDDDMGSGFSVSVSTFNSTEFIIAWIDDGTTTETASFARYDVDGNNVIAQTVVSDNDVATSQDIAVAVVNESSFAIAWYDMFDDSIRMETFVGTTVIADDAIVDAIAGSYSEIDIEVINETHLVLAWIEFSNPSFSVVTFNGTIDVPTTDIGTIATTGNNIQVGVINDSAFAVIFTDDAPASINIGTFQTNGSVIRALTEVTAGDDAGIDLFSQDHQIGFCDDNFVYTAFDGVNNIWRGNHSGNFTEWDGSCFAIPAPPEVPPTPPQAVLVKELFFPNASTSSSTFITIGTAMINITRLSDIDAVISFQARREGGTGADNYSWRILVDNEARRNITRTLTPTDIGSVVFSGDRDDISIGEHNVTLQHLATEGTLFTENIDLVVNLHLVENNTRVNHESGNIDTTHSSTSYTEVSTGTMEVTEDSMVMALLTLSTQSTDVNTVEYRLEFNNENSSSFRRRMKNSDDIGSIGYLWQYNNVSIGTITWKLWGRNSDAVTTQIEGHLDLDQMINDNVPTTMSHFSNESTTIDVANTFIQVANVTIPTVRNNSVYVASAFTVNIENQGAVTRNVSYFLQSDNKVSQLLSRTLADVDDIGNLFIQHIFNDTNITHNVSLFVASELGGARVLIVSNVSLYVMEVVDFESVITAPVPDTSPPVITLIDAINNTRNNTDPINITLLVQDATTNLLTCSLQNATEQFDSKDVTEGVNFFLTLDSGLPEINQNFQLEVTCGDNEPANNTQTLNFNFTLDNILPVITTIFPFDGNRFNRDIIPSIAVSGTCTDNPVFRYNITITNVTDTVFSAEDVSPVNNVLSISDTLSIANLGVGNYTVTHTCSDPHTKQNIADYTVKKNNSDNKIKWTTPKGTEIEIKYSVPAKNGIEALSFGSLKADTNDRYYFWYKINATEDGTERTFTFELENKKQKTMNYFESSRYKAHFVTENNWIDFEFDDENATYLVTKNDNSNYEIEITTTKTYLNFSSVGELNIAVETTTFEIFFVEQIIDHFSVIECKIDTGSVILLGIFIILSLIVIGIGFGTNVGFVGFFGSLMLMVTSWYIAPCIGILAFIITLFSVLLMFYFISKGFFTATSGN